MIKPYMKGILMKRSCRTENDYIKTLKKAPLTTITSNQGNYHV